MPRGYDPVGAMGGLFAPAHIFGDPESQAAIEAWTARQRPPPPPPPPPPTPLSQSSSPLPTTSSVGLNPSAMQPFAGAMPAGAYDPRDQIAMAIMQQGGETGSNTAPADPSLDQGQYSTGPGPFSDWSDPPGPDAPSYGDPADEGAVGGSLGGFGGPSGGSQGGFGGPAGGTQGGASMGGGFGSAANTAAAQAAQEGMATGLDTGIMGLGPTVADTQTGMFSSPGFGPEATAQAVSVDNNPYSSVDATTGAPTGIGYGVTGLDTQGVAPAEVGPTTDPGSYGPTGYGYGVSPGYDAMASMDAPGVDAMGGGFGEGPGSEGGLGGPGSEGGLSSGTEGNEGSNSGSNDSGNEGGDDY